MVFPVSSLLCATEDGGSTKATTGTEACPTPMQTQQRVSERVELHLFEQGEGLTRRIHRVGYMKKKQLQKEAECAMNKRYHHSYRMIEGCCQCFAERR